jgi:hypothetical protein
MSKSASSSCTLAGLERRYNRFFERDYLTMKVAVTVIGWLAIGTLGVWLAWWMLTLTSTTPSASVTITLGTVLLLAWLAGTLLVWRHSWLAAFSFASVSTLPLTPEHALPQPYLLMACSASLALGSWLAGFVNSLEQRRRAQVLMVDNPTGVESHRIQLQGCLICLEPAETTICAACTEALGHEVGLWLPQPETPSVDHDGVHGVSAEGATRSS